MTDQIQKKQPRSCGVVFSGDNGSRTHDLYNAIVAL